MSKTRVLIVEDVLREAMSLRSALEDESFEVVGIANSDADAKRQFKESLPNVVTMDIDLDGEDGIALARELKAIDDNVAIIFITKYHDNETMERALAIQPLGYLRKRPPDWSIDRTDLRLAIRMALKLQSAIQMRAVASHEGQLVFISYAHIDEGFLIELETHLVELRRNGIIFSDHCIEKGSKPKEEIKKALRNTRVGMLLVSSEFQASEFIREIELPSLLEKDKLLYVIVRPCRILPEIAEYWCINDGMPSMEEMRIRADRDKVWMKVADLIEGHFPELKRAAQVSGTVDRPARGRDGVSTTLPAR